MKTKQAQVIPLVRFVLSAFCLLALLVPTPSFAADTGTVKGKITDKADGEGVYGASVTVAGTTIGTATDMNGNYTLKGVPAKQQKIAVSIVGYASASQVVNVGANQTAVVNLSLGQTTIMASEVVVGAALYKQDRLDVPTTTNVVSAEKIKEEPNPSLDKTLETVPGVNINRSSGYSASTVQIRGSNTFQGGGIGTRVAAFYDGIPLSTPETGGIVWTNINMNSANRMEVVKGASTTLYGSGAMGGVVNVYGYLPDKFEVKAGISGGFYDAPPSSDKSVYRDGYTPWFWNSYVGIGDKAGKLSYSLLYTHSDDDGYRDNSQTLLNDVKLKARYDIDAKQYLQLSASYNETEAGYVSTWPYDIEISMATDPPTTTYIPYPERAYDLVNEVYTDDIVSRKDAFAGLTYTNMLSDKLTLEGKLYYTYNQYRIDYNPTDLPQQFLPIGPGAFIYDRAPGEFNENRSGRYGAGVKLDWRASDKHRMLFGVDGNMIDVKSTQYAAEIPLPGEFGEVQEKNIALFIQDEWKITDRLTALLSLRYDWSGIDADEVIYRDNRFFYLPESSRLILTNTIENKSVDALSPRIALNYKATDDMSFRASWGKSFRAPTLAERFVRDAGLFMGNPNPALDKETMTGYEIGVYKQFGDKVSLDLAAYLNDYDDLIESRNINIDPITGEASFPVVFEYQNIAKARIWGIETSLNIRPNPQWNFSLGYAYMNAKDKTGDAGALAGSQNPDPEWLAYRPEHTGSISATWKPIEKFALNLTGRYVGKYKAVSNYPNPEGENYPGDFVVFNAGAKYQATDNIGLNFLVKNITNEQYEEAEWFRAPGRSFVLGVDLTY